MSRTLRRATTVATATTLLAGSLAALALSPVHANPAGTDLVISEVYGAGGNTGATFDRDFVELYNPTGESINLSGLSIQYRSATGSAGGSPAALSGQVPAGSTFLIQMSGAGAHGATLPTPDLVSSPVFNMAAGAGQVLLISGSEFTGSGDLAGNASLVDMVGYGPTSTSYEGSPTTPALGATTSAHRNAAGTDTDVNSVDFTNAAPTPVSCAGDCAAPPPPPPPENDLEIDEIQGTGMTSDYVGEFATTTGVVTAAYPTGGFFGFYLQMSGTGAADLDLETHVASPAIFVYQPFGTGGVTVEPGDHVQVRGLVNEYAGATQLTIESAEDIEVLEDPADPVVTTTSAWPETAEQKETLEGMLYRPTGDFTITETYFTNQFGEVGLARGTTPLLQWTEVARPGTPEADAVKADNEMRRIVLDDASSTNFLATSNVAGDCTPRPTPCLVNGHLTPPYVSTTDPIRVGAAATFTSDVIFTQGGSPSAPTYRFQPLTQVVGPDNTASPAEFENTRTAAPDEELINATGTADLKVAAFNVLNYFTTLGDPDDVNVSPIGCLPFTDRDGDGATVRTGCDPRGAWDPLDFEKQEEKIVAAINALDADVVGLMEIENSARLGEDTDEATESLVAALNADAGSDVWAANPSSADLPPAASQDVITNAIIYKPAAVERHGEARALGDQSGTGEAFVNAREPIAQAFTPVGGDDPFLVVVNHFKSKGSAGPFPGDADAGDGQGASNGSRVLQATALRDWVPGVQTDLEVDDVLLIGDFNSYSMEDPLQVLYDADYTNVEQHYGNEEYSYSFSSLAGSLDHVLANESALARSTGTDIWNINSGEALALEYSRWNYHATDFHEPGPYRSSDHDPVVLGLDSGVEPVDPVASTTSATVAPDELVVDETIGEAAVVVTADEGEGVPSGTVEVHVSGPSAPEGETLVFTGSLDGAGEATVEFGPLPALGEHDVWVEYLGDADTLPSSSAVTEVTVVEASDPDPATPTVTVTVEPTSVVAGTGTAAVGVTVTSDGETPTGEVTLLVDGAVTDTATLSDAGTAAFTVGPFSKAGSHTVQVQYAGDAATAAGSSATTTLVVTKAKAKMKVVAKPKKIKVGKTRAKVIVTVTAAGLVPSGKVKVKVGSVKRTGTLNAKGKVKVKLPRFAKVGKKKVKVTYLGDDAVKRATKRITLRVIRK